MMANGLANIRTDKRITDFAFIKEFCSTAFVTFRVTCHFIGQNIGQGFQKMRFT